MKTHSRTEIIDLTADKIYEYDSKNTVRIDKAELAVVQRNIAGPSSRVVARQNDAEKVPRERALARARQQKRRALKKAAKTPHALVTDPGIEHVTSTFFNAALGHKLDLVRAVALSHFQKLI